MAFPPLPLPLEAQLPPDFSRSRLNRARHRSPHPAFTCSRRRTAPGLTCAGASQLLPLLCALEIRAPGLHRALHRPHAALSKGTDTIPRSHSHVRPAGSCRCPLPVSTGTGQRPGPRCGARSPVTPARAAGRPCTCCSFRPAAPPSPPGRLRLRHPGALASSSAGLRCPSRRRPRDAGSAPNGEGARTQASRGRPPGAGTGSGSAGPHGTALGPGRSCMPVGAARVLPSSVAGGRPQAADRATLSRGQLPELGGINHVPAGLERGDEGRRLFLIVAVSGHPRRSPGLADRASHPGPERQREIRRLTQGKGWGRDQGKQRAAEGGGDPRRGGGGALRHRKQSAAGPRGLGPGVGWEGGLG